MDGRRRSVREEEKKIFFYHVWKLKKNISVNLDFEIIATLNYVEYNLIKFVICPELQYTTKT